MKGNNKGFTLVELIVVMAIISVVMALVSLSVATSTSARAKQCAASIDVLISKCRMDSLSRSGIVYLEISLNGDGDIVCKHSDGTTVSTDTFPANNITVTYTTRLGLNAPVAVPLAGNPLTLSFNRSTGAQTLQVDGSACTSISFAGGITRTIRLVPSTGFHELT